MKNAANSLMNTVFLSRIKGLGIILLIIGFWVFFGYLAVNGLVLLIEGFRDGTYGGMVNIALDVVILLVYFLILSLPVFVLSKVVLKALWRRRKRERRKAQGYVGHP